MFVYICTWKMDCSCFFLHKIYHFLPHFYPFEMHLKCFKRNFLCKISKTDISTMQKKKQYLECLYVLHLPRISTLSHFNFFAAIIYFCGIGVFNYEQK